MGKIFYIMGKSSTGKDTIYEALKGDIKELCTITLYTTRPIRQGETDGIHYHFVGEKKLQYFEGAGKVIELRSYHTAHGVWKYFTADDGQIDLDKNSYLGIGTLESYEKMKEYFCDKIIPIYIQVEDGERLQRALIRERLQISPKYTELCRRFIADTEDFSEENLIRAKINIRFENRQLKSCVDEIALYIRKQL